jgi:hypothetical protein
MKAPLVSVIIICYNYGRYLEEAVQSVRSQTYLNKEILIIDGGSDDPSTLKIVKSYSSDNDIKVFIREGRHLVGDNRNFGIEKAEGEFICCLDADDRLRPSYIEKAMLSLFEFGADLVSPSSESFGEKQKIGLLKLEPTIDDILNENQLNTVALFKKSLWQHVGGYVDFGLGSDHFYEDWHFWMRCIACGAKVRNLCFETLFNYRVHHAGSLSRQGGKVPDLEKQRAFIRKEYESLELDPYPVTHLTRSTWTAKKSTAIWVVPAFDGTILEFLRPKRTSYGSTYSPVLVASGSVFDREDRSGSLFDEISESHFDLVRSFKSMGLLALLKYLLESREIEEIVIFGESLDSETLGKLLRIFPSLNVREEQIVPPESSVPTVKVSLENIACKSGKSEGIETWFLGIRRWNGLLERPEAFLQSYPGWKSMESNAAPQGYALLADAAASIEIEIPSGSKLFFLKHSWSGILKISLGTEAKELDLYSEHSEILSFSIAELLDEPSEV